jgi:hypothetical protein
MVIYKKVFCILALSLIFSLLMLAIPMMPALAQPPTPEIELSPTSGVGGTAVTVTGTGFSSYPRVYIFFNQNYTNQNPAVEDGEFEATFNIPGSADAGTAYIYVQYTSAFGEGFITSAPFTVVGRAITLSPLSGCVGNTVIVDGTGFTASSSVTIYFGSASVGTAETDADGNFDDATFTVPASCVGTHTVKGEDENENYATTDFTVSPKITLTPASGSSGDTITVRGTGFKGSSNVTIYFGSTTLGTATTDINGSFTDNTITIPSTSRGGHTIKAEDVEGNDANATFTVAQKITITPTNGGPGATVTVNGIGFDASKTVTIKYNGVAVNTTPTTINTDDTGNFSGSFIVPASSTGTYAVEASDSIYSASANFTITIDINLSTPTSEASPGHVGMEMTLSGSGFTPNSPITITYATTPIVIATTTSDNNGDFSATFEIPKSEYGAHTITASDGTTTLQTTFIMEQTAPATTKLLLPAIDDDAKSRPFLDWESVTKDVNGASEPSTPVTYDLQIASDADFSNIVLEKTGLTSSGYTLLKGEGLESKGKEAPYYWRVRAVDAASNVGDWSNCRTFYVSSSWIMYVLIGGGVLLIFFIGFFVGRGSKRSSYY